MDKTKQNWYVQKQPERLVLIYDFFYEEDSEEGVNAGSCRGYDEQFMEFLDKNGITTDKIIKHESAGEGHDVIHAYGDGGIEPLALVKHVSSAGAESKYPFDNDTVLVFIGEIPNMPGHCAVAEYKTGRMHFGYHIEDFKVINDV